jgi:hypothetical protein
MAEELAQLMRSATENLVLPAQAATDAITGFRRKRRRHLAAAAAVTACAVAAAVALPMSTTDSSGRQDINRVIPASPSPTIVPLASVSGVDVTYLPAGLVVLPGFVLGAMIKEDGHTSVSQYYQPPSGVTGGNSPEVSLAVQRGFTVNLDTFAAEAKGMTGSWTTVDGKRALLQTSPVDQGTGNVGYELTWVAVPDVTVTVYSSGPVSLPEVRRVAEGLVVHPGAPAPADPAAANVAIRQVMTQVFSGGQSVDVTLGAIENGQQLSAVLAKLHRVDPVIMQTAEVTTNKITFVGPDQAVASITISYRVPSQPNVNTEQVATVDVTVDFTGSRWLVSQSSYCFVVSPLVGGCP